MIERFPGGHTESFIEFSKLLENFDLQMLLNRPLFIDLYTVQNEVGLLLLNTEAGLLQYAPVYRL